MLLTNTLTKKKEEFVPLEGHHVMIYACGVTPYDNSHIGHGRSYIFVDLLVRFLRFSDFDVRYVRNVTDIDDKLIRKAEEAGDVNLYRGIAEKFTKLYQDEMGKLNCLTPDHEPKVTDNIPQIIDFISGLIKKSKAYVVDGDVYFDVSSYEPYGQLSGKQLEDLVAGARVSVDERKKNPADFALWKGNEEGLFWKSPWGYGRPGWHIECSVLAKEYLGDTIDIHCGGADLIFPHHENERAQSESLHDATFARYWLHNALLNIDKEKMSKSLGNILSLKEIFEKHDPMVLRYYFLQHHYRTPVEFAFDRLDSAKVAYKKLVNLFEDVAPDSFIIRESSVLQKMITALEDDLNTPKMLGILFEHISDIRDDQRLKASCKAFLQDVLGLTLDALQEDTIELTPEVTKLLREREQARAAKNWAVADAIRDQLKALGYEVQDRKL